MIKKTTLLLTGSALVLGALAASTARANFYTALNGEFVFPMSSIPSTRSDPLNSNGILYDNVAGRLGGGVGLVFGYHFNPRSVYQQYGVEISYNYWGITNQDVAVATNGSTKTAPSNLNHNNLVVSFSYKLPVLATGLYLRPAVGLGFDVINWSEELLGKNSYNGVAGLFVPKLELNYDMPLGNGALTFGAYLKYYVLLNGVTFTNSNNANDKRLTSVADSLAFGITFGGSF